MADVDAELNSLLGPANGSLNEDVLRELQSILRLHSLSPQDLFYKWEGYCIKMRFGEESRLNLDTVRDFKKDLHESLERTARGKPKERAPEKRVAAGATPRNARPAEGSDVFAILDNLNAVADTPRAAMNPVNGNSIKRKNDFDTPAAKANKPHAKSSPQASVTPAGAAVPFAERKNAGDVEQTLNDFIQPSEPPSVPFSDPRIKLKAHTDLAKFAYKPMAMKLTDASEILDDRIDAFMELVQNHHNLDEGVFGNPAAQSSNEIVVVGRIASESSETKLSSSTILLETSRRMGGGLRVPLQLESVPNYDLFPGKIVALRGNNASGEKFGVSEVLDMPLLAPPASKAWELQTVKSRLQGGSPESSVTHPLNILVASGPYTAETNLDFEPFQAVCDKAKDTSADALVLIGPFLDIEHPLLAAGDIPPLNSALQIDEDSATLTSVFQSLISAPLQRLAQALPTITIVMIPSVRDAVDKHVSWPQDKMIRKDLGLPKQVACVTNPVTISLNEILVGASSQDILYELKQERCASATANSKGLEDAPNQDILARLSRHLIEQRHFYPIFPPASRSNLPKPSNSLAVTGHAQPAKSIGSMIDISYSLLGEWQQVKPDILITPSALPAFVKVVDGVIVINPGPVSKRRAAGTLASLTVTERTFKGEEVAEAESNPEAYFGHNVFDRARVDILRI